MSVQTQVMRLEELISKLPTEGDKRFANSLVGQWRTKRRLSQAQQLYVDKLLDKALNPPEEQPKLVVEVAATNMSLVKLHALFDKARANHVQVPRLRMALTDMKRFSVSAAPATGKNPGAIYVQLEDKYYGKITKDGRFEIPAYVGRGRNAELEQRIFDVAEDPSKAGRIHGHRVRWCMFCGLELRTTDSLYYGYGPICAEKWGLEWGDAVERKFEDSVNSASNVFATAVAQFMKKE